MGNFLAYLSLLECIVNAFCMNWCRLPSQPIRCRSPKSQLAVNYKASSVCIPRRPEKRERSERIDEWLTHGNNPIPLIFHIPSANASRFIATYTALTIHSVFLVPSVSYLAKTVLVCTRPCSGDLNSMNTIMMLKICSELPDMYIMMAFMGSAFAGASATSQAFFIFSVSISSGEEGFRVWDLEVMVRWKKCLVGSVGLLWKRERGKEWGRGNYFAVGRRGVAGRIWDVGFCFGSGRRV